MWEEGQTRWVNVEEDVKEDMVKEEIGEGRWVKGEGERQRKIGENGGGGRGRQVKMEGEVEEDG